MKSVFNQIENFNLKCKIYMKNVKTSGNTTNSKTHIKRQSQKYINVRGQ